MKNKLVQSMKRGLCVFLAGTMILCSGTTSFAAEMPEDQNVAAMQSTEMPESEGKTGAGVTVADTEETESTGVPESAEGTENTEVPESAESTEVPESAESTEVPESTEGTEGTESTEVPESAEGTEVPEPTEGTESTEVPESTEGTEGTESTEVPESAEGTESTEVPESAEGTEDDTDAQGGKELLKKASLIEAGARIVLAESSVIVNVGESITLPGYTIEYKDESKKPEAAPKVKWLQDDMGIVSLNEKNGTAKAAKPGVAYLQLQVVGETDIYAKYQIIVRPGTPNKASVEMTSYNFVKLAWEKVEAADGYLIYRKSEKDADYTELARINGESNVSYTDKKQLSVGTDYAYRIYAYVEYKDAGNQTKYEKSAEWAMVKATPALGQVTVTGIASNGSSSATITWNELAGASGYTIYRAAGNSSSYQEIKSVGAEYRSYTDNKLSAGQSYSYKVAAYCNVNGNKVYGKESKILTIKPVPMAPEMQVASYDHQTVKLSWTRVEGVSGYAVYRKVSGTDKFSKIATVKGIDKISYTDKTVKTGTKYTYKVRAYAKTDSGDVYGAYSAEKSVTPVMAAPKVSLTNLAYDSIKISWNKINGADGYRIYRANRPDGAYESVKRIKDDAVLSYEDSGLKVGGTYYYKVCAYRVVGSKNVNGRKSDAVSLQTIPAAPTVKASAAGATAIKLTWSKVELPSKNSGYYVYQIVDGKEKRVKTCSNSASSYTVKKLVPGETYTFKVAAYAKDSAGNIIKGQLSKAITATPELLAVSIDEVVSVSHKEMAVKWKATKAADEDSYLVYRSTSSKKGYKKIGTVQRQNGATQYTYTDKNLSVGTKYYYKIVCAKKLPNGTTIKSGYSKQKSAVAKPGKTTVTVQTNQYNSLKISWKKVKGPASNGYVNGYVIYRSTSKDGKYKKIKTITSGTTKNYVDEGLEPGKVYYYKVRPYCNINNKALYGEYSNVKSKKVVPGKLSINVKSVDYNTVKVSWKTVEGCDGYSIYRAAAADGKYQHVKNVASDKTSYTDKKLTTGATYYYKVRGYCLRNSKKIYGSYSSVKSAMPVLGMPKDLKAAAIGDNQIKLTWSKVAGADTYTVLRSDSANGKYKIATEICETNSFIDTNVKNGKSYYYKVYAVRGDAVSAVTDCVTVVAVTLTISVPEVVVKTGSSVKVTATAKPAAVVMWSSANTSVALVTSDGVVYGMKAGTTTLSATANGVTKTVTVTVKDTLEKKGLEISAADGNVDFNAVKASGYEYVMLRISDGTVKDKNFETNYTNAKAVGLKVGVTCYARARTKAEAEKEAYQVIAILNGRAIDYPVVYDMEEITLLYGLTSIERSDIVDSFKNVIVNVGKKPFVLCASAEWLTKYLDNSRLKGVNLWITNYRAVNLGHGYTGAGNVVMWRYTNKGVAGGIDGNAKISMIYLPY